MKLFWKENPVGFFEIFFGLNVTKQYHDTPIWLLTEKFPKRQESFFYSIVLMCPREGFPTG
jgi:hypothetical protein